MLDFKINSIEVDKMGELSKEEKDFRVQQLNYFNKVGFPNKRDEDWKFSDLREIFLKNFKKLEFNQIKSQDEKIEFVKEFEHNFILTSNGKLITSDFKYEDEDSISIESFKNNNFSINREKNSLIHLNHALSDNGFFLEVKENYKFKKVLIIYNLFTSALNENFLNFRNKINIKKKSEVHIIELNINKSKNIFFSNTYEDLKLENSAVLKKICIHNNKNKGYFHKYSTNNLSGQSNYSSYIFPSGPKFNKLDLNVNLNGENSEYNLNAATFLSQNEHQEIKTRINHLVPNCKSYQKVKKVVDTESKGVYQGKIYVRDIAQKTNAYQISKAILLNENSEFNSKPELEIYADDVKCSHGSTSGSIDEDSIYYLMSRGLNRKESIELLIEGFLNEISHSIKSNTIKEFVQKKLKEQII